MSKVKDFHRLAGEWQMAKEAVSIAQLAVDLKMTEHLHNKGPAPTRKEMEQIDDLRSIECQRRDALDEFMSEYAT